MTSPSPLPPMPDPATPHPATPAFHHDEDWPQRSWGLALLGGLVGLAVYWITRPDTSMLESGSFAQLRVALAIFLTVTAAAFAIVVERKGIALSLGFAALCGAVLALTVYGSGPFFKGGHDEPWRIACAALAIAIAAPLFQAWRNSRAASDAGESLTLGRATIGYHCAFNSAWTDTVLWLSAWVFVGICWLLVMLLGALFSLIGIDWIQDLLRREGVLLVLTGTMLGAGIGLLRDRETVLSLLQRVVTTVLAVLAPVLATGLVFFLIMLPFTGLGPLWQATNNTTPILLFCIIGALCLINAVVGSEGNPAAVGVSAAPVRLPRRVLWFSAVALSVTLLPLALISAVSTGLRIHQYGITPDRLWAIVFVAIAVAYGLAYLVSLLRSVVDGMAEQGKLQSFTPLLRKANLRLAVALCILAGVLASPLINFGALSTKDQISRLQSGKTAEDAFDWQALRFDFGPSGLAATKDLASNGATPAIREAATKALEAEDRWSLSSPTPKQNQTPIDPERLTVLPHTVNLPAVLQIALNRSDVCGSFGPCAVFYTQGADEAVVVTNWNSLRLLRKDAEWLSQDNQTEGGAVGKAPAEAIKAGGKVEIRTVTRSQVYVDGKPVNNLFK